MQEQDAAYRGLVTERGLRMMQHWGYAVTLAWALALLTWAFLWPDPYADGWWLVLELLAIGRTVSTYEGIRLGFSHTYLFVQGGAQDIAMFLVIFPIFARVYEKVARGRGIDRLFSGLSQAAERHQERLQGFGAVGLFLFVFFPVSSTGTLVGTIVGYLIGLRMRIVVPVVIAAHLSSLALLLAFFDWLEPTLRSLNQSVAQYFAWLFLAAVVALGAVLRLRKTRRAARNQRPKQGVPLTEQAAGAETEE